MSNQYVLSRRKALTLFGISAASIAAATTQPNPSAAHANTGELDTIAGSARAQYIFGYGSLVQRESRMGSWASAEFASPVIVKGVARGWFDQTGGVSWNPTYLGGVLDKNATCKGGDSFEAKRWCVRLSSVVCSAAGLGGLGFESD